MLVYKTDEQKFWKKVSFSGITYKIIVRNLNESVEISKHVPLNGSAMN